MQKWFVCKFGQNLFALKYEAANDTKETESGIEFVRTFKLKSVL